MGSVKKMDSIDRAVSGVLHRATSQLIALFLLPSTWIHNGAQGVTLLILSLVFVLVEHNASLDGRSLQSGETTAISLAYFCHVILMLITTKTLKKKFGRDRPVSPAEGAPNRRMINMRGRENNHSFPSGDTA